MNRALKLALTIAAVIAIAVYLVTRSSPSEAAFPAAAATRSEREEAKAALALAGTPQLNVGSADNQSRKAVVAKEDLGASLEILGRVVDELDRPIEEFAIHAIHRDEHNVFIERRDWPRAIHAHGEFELRGLAPGYWDIVPFADDLTRPGVRSFASSPTERIVFTMSGSAVIDGVVLDADGWPVANASVRVEQFATQTNDEGKFELRLSPGAYRLHAEAPGYALSDEFEFRLGTRDHITEVRLGLNRHTLLRGVLLDEKGAPLSGWSIEAEGRRTPLVTATSDEHGRFELAVGKPENLELSALVDSDVRGPRERYATTVLAADVGGGIVVLRKVPRRAVRVQGTITSPHVGSDVASGDPDRRGRTYITAQSVDGRLIRGVGFHDNSESSSAFDMELPSPGRYLFRLADRSNVEFGSQIVDVPDRDDFEVTLDF